MVKKLNYIFHNPNTNEVLVDYLIEVFVRVNMKKLEEAILKDIELRNNILENANIIDTIEANN